IVPLSIGAPAAVTMRAPRIATTFGVSARSASGSATKPTRSKRFISSSFVGAGLQALRSFGVTLVELELLVVLRHVSAGDDDVRDRRAHLEGIAFRDEQIRDLAALEAPDFVGDAEDLGGVDRDGLQRFVARQAPADRLGGVIGQLP